MKTRKRDMFFIHQIQKIAAEVKPDKQGMSDQKEDPGLSAESEEKLKASQKEIYNSVVHKHKKDCNPEYIPDSFEGNPPDKEAEIEKQAAEGKAVYDGYMLGYMYKEAEDLEERNETIDEAQETVTDEPENTIDTDVIPGPKLDINKVNSDESSGGVKEKSLNTTITLESGAMNPEIIDETGEPEVEEERPVCPEIIPPAENEDGVIVSIGVN